MSSYCFINIPQISINEWHPFSISNSIYSTSTVFYIKNMFNNSFSHKINKLSNCNIHPNNITINIEGPYGYNLNYNDYTKIIFIAGGIGITPIHNMFFTLYKHRLNSTNNNSNNIIPELELIWIARKADAFTLYTDSFRMFKQHPIDNMFIKLFATRERGSIASHNDLIQNRHNKHSITHINCISQRPNLFKELSHLNEYNNNALIYVCGPDSLVEDLTIIAYKNGNHIRRETFLL